MTFTVGQTTVHKHLLLLCRKHKNNSGGKEPEYAFLKTISRYLSVISVIIIISISILCYFILLLQYNSEGHFALLASPYFIYLIKYITLLKIKLMMITKNIVLI